MFYRQPYGNVRVDFRARSEVWRAPLANHRTDRTTDRSGLRPQRSCGDCIRWAVAHAEVWCAGYSAGLSILCILSNYKIHACFVGCRKNTKVSCKSERSTVISQRNVINTEFTTKTELTFVVLRRDTKQHRGLQNRGSSGYSARAGSASHSFSARSNWDLAHPEIRFLSRKQPNCPVGWLKKSTVWDPRIDCAQISGHFN